MKHSFSGFTLVEMLVVIGIIAVLIGASFGSYNAFVKKASRGRCAELVHDVQVAIVGVMQKENAWPRGLLAAQGAPRDGILTKEAGAALAKRGALSLTYRKTEDQDGNSIYELSGNDRCGVVTPWAADVIKHNVNATGGTDVPSGGIVDDHRLHFALDDDFDGRVNASVGGVGITVRASAIVWCGGANGVIAPYPYAGGGGGGGGHGENTGTHKGDRNDDVYSWSPDQVE